MMYLFLNLKRKKDKNPSNLRSRRAEVDRSAFASKRKQVDRSRCVLLFTLRSGWIQRKRGYLADG
jgi:hypothetical protein